MQTFLPYDDFNKCAEVLDIRRLGKQRVETYQIMNVLAGLNTGSGWVNHPAVKMWRGHEEYLLYYQESIVKEWSILGYKDTCLEKTKMSFSNIKTKMSKPEWLGLDILHASHRSNLLRKNKDFYGLYSWKEPDNMPYYWPVN
jgi:hypothetical protein